MTMERPNVRETAQTSKVASIRSAALEADKGVFISQEAMDAWVASWGTDAELSPPEPDIRLETK